MIEAAKAIAKAVGVAGASSTYSDNAAWIAAMAKDLQSAKGRSLVVAGDNQPAAVHALAHLMNDALGNVGHTVIYAEPFFPNSEKSQLDQYRELIADIDAGKVKLLVIIDGNPMYNTPADLRLDAARMEKVPFRAHLGLYRDETAEFCHWHVPSKHYLESWGDVRAYDGTASIVQPLISPIYDGHSVYELVQLFFKENFDKKDLDIVKGYWEKTGIMPAATKAAPAVVPAEATVSAGEKTSVVAVPAAKASPAPEAKPATSPAAPAAGKTFEDNWRKAVHDGLIPNTAAAAKTVTANTAFLSQPAPAANGSGALEISIRPDPSVYDGRFTNNGWLQELPNPLNKVTWTNVGLISPKTAEKLGINQSRDVREQAGGAEGVTFYNTKGGNLFSDQVRITYQGAEVKEPVAMWITPGQPDDTITLHMGYGRSRAGT